MDAIHATLQLTSLIAGELSAILMASATAGVCACMAAVLASSGGARSSATTASRPALPPPPEDIYPSRESWSGPEPGDPQSLYELAITSCLKYGNRLAFGYLPSPGAPPGTRRHVSYAEMGYMIMRVARSLAALGVRPGDRVMLLAPNSVEWAVVAYGANALGATYTALYPQARATDWLLIFKDARPRVLVVDTSAQWDELRRAAAAASTALPRTKVIVIGDRAARAPVLTGGAGAVLPPESRTAGAKPRSFPLPFWGERAATPPPPLPFVSPGTRLRRARRSRVISWEAFYALGAASTQRVRLGVAGPAAIAALVYTSGTTGVPKGAMLTNWNIVSNILASQHIGRVRPGERSAAMLPWTHAFGATFDLHFMVVRGAHINIVSDVSRFAAEVAAIQPHVLLAVPRVWEALRDRVCQAADASPLRRRLFEAARAEAAERLRGAGFDAEAVPPRSLRDKVLDALVWRKVRQSLGGELRLCISGAAPLPGDVLDFVRMVGVTVYEGYGLTETAPLVAANGVHGLRSCARGTVGHLVPGVRAELDRGALLCANENHRPRTGGTTHNGRGRDVRDDRGRPDPHRNQGGVRGLDPALENHDGDPGRREGGLGEDVADELCEGELVVYGPNVMAGYWRNWKQTREVLRRDGGLRTGDLAVFTRSGHLRITGRLREHFKLANGKYVSPEPLEQSLARGHAVVGQCLVDGRGKRAPYAIVVPNREALSALLRAAGDDVGDGSLSTMCARAGAAMAVLQALRGGPVVRDPAWRPFERLQAVILDPEEWTVGNGMLTPTLKTKRHAVLDRHADAIARVA